MAAGRRRSTAGALAGGDGVGDVKARIIDAATEILGRDGYGALSVSAICKASDVSAPTLYWHFGSKEGLLAKVLRSVLKRDAQAFFDLDVANLTHEEAFDRHLAALRGIVVSDRPNNWVVLSALSEARRLAPEIAGIIAEARRRQVEFNAEQLRVFWGLENNRLFVHHWLAFCNYVSLLYQDTRDATLTDEAIKAFRETYFVLVGALGEKVADRRFTEVSAAARSAPQADKKPPPQSPSPEARAAKPVRGDGPLRKRR